MTASLYHCGSVSILLGTVVIAQPRSLHKVVKITFGLNAPANSEDLCGTDLWIQCHEVPFSLPEKAGVADQVVHLVRAVAGQSQVLKRDLHPARLRVVRIEIDDRQDDIA